jgi:hypothetical protein
VRNRVEVARQVGVHYLDVTGLQTLVHLPDRILRGAARSVAVCVVSEVRLEDGLQDKLHRSLRDPVLDGGNAQRALPTIRLGYHHPQHGFRSVLLLSEFLAKFRKEPLSPCCLDIIESLPVHARCPGVSFRQGIGMGQDVSPMHLVIQSIETVGRLSLGLPV